MPPSASPSPLLPTHFSPLFVKLVAYGILTYVLVVFGLVFFLLWLRGRATRALFDRVIERHRVDWEKFNIDGCVICLESFEEGEECCVIKTCNHWYHESCIKQWLSNGGTLHCPLCRGPLPAPAGP